MSELPTFTVHLTHVVSTSRTVQAEDYAAAIDVAQQSPDLPTPGSRVGEDYDAAGEWEPSLVESDGVEVWSQAEEDAEGLAADDGVLAAVRRQRDELRAEVERLRGQLSAASGPLSISQTLGDIAVGASVIGYQAGGSR